MSIFTFEPRGDSRMVPVGWEERIELCDNEHEVLQIAREFLANLEPWEVANLPPSCAPRKLFTASDVSEYAFEMVCYERDHGVVNPLLEKMGSFFARATIRLSRLMGTKANDEDGHMRESA